MERLYKTGYTLITLTTDYKSHPQILDQYNCQVYNKQLQATPLTWHWTQWVTLGISLLNSVITFRSRTLQEFPVSSSV